MLEIMLRGYNLRGYEPCYVDGRRDADEYLRQPHAGQRRPRLAGERRDSEDTHHRHRFVMRSA